MGKLKKILSLSLALFVGVTFSAAVCANDTYAVSKPGKVTISSAKASGSNSAVIKWKKASNSPTGYLVYRNSKKIATTKSLSYTDSSLSPSTTYSYAVRAYKNYKVKYYYNTKKKKWTTSKPAKKYWKGKKTKYVTKTIYGNTSATKKIKTAASPTKNIQANGKTYSLAVGQKFTTPSTYNAGTDHEFNTKSYNITITSILLPVSDDLENWELRGNIDGGGTIYIACIDETIYTVEVIMVDYENELETIGDYGFWRVKTDSFSYDVPGKYGSFYCTDEDISCLWTNDRTEPSLNPQNGNLLNKSNTNERSRSNINNRGALENNTYVWVKIYDGEELILESINFRE